MGNTIFLYAIIYITAALSLTAVILLTVLLISRKKDAKPNAYLEKMQADILNQLRDNRIESSESLKNTLTAYLEAQTSSNRQIAQMQDVRLADLQKSIAVQLTAIDKRFGDLSLQTEQKLENIRATMENRITALQNENTKSLNEMRHTVDEKLQKTLDDKLKQSFSLVSERLEQVYKGLGEMQNLASGVGDLKKVLSNVKTRGILGEIQLGAILEQILSPEQYEENIATKPGSSDRVEYAVKLPGDGEKPIYLPIDAKFPADAYAQLMDAYEKGDSAAIASLGTALEQRIKSFAKDIHNKYISVPDTTDFAILFLPVEGLYAEVVRRGLVETLQRDYKINIAGPTTMAALLNSLQMGFKTLAIQKRSGEVWKVLSGVKAEFETFAKALSQAQQRIKQADNEIENLIGVRTRQIQRKLKDVESLPGTDESLSGDKMLI